MADDLDKYPADSDRRRFVKGVVGGASLLTAGGTAAASVDVLTAPGGAGGGSVSYFGMENVDGPAPRAMPQIPVELDGEGYLRGIWPTNFDEEKEVAYKEYQLPSGTFRYESSWFQYCGVQESPAIDPKADKDNYFYYTGGNKYEWQSEEVSKGDKVHIDHFSDYETWNNGIGRSGVGKPAAVTWRSQDLDPANTLPVQIIRSPLIEEKAKEDPWVKQTTTKGFVANLNKCTHFCCVPGFKHSSDSVKFGGPNEIYCQCHQSIYDPFSIVQRSFTALPRPE